MPPMFRILQTRSGIWAIRCRDLIDQLQLARPLRGAIPRAQTRALQHPCRVMCGIRQSRIDSGSEIEVSVTVGIRTRELEKSLRRRMQYVRLVRGRLRAGTLEPQLEAQMLYGRKRDAQRHRGRPITTQPVSALLPCDGTRRRKAHVPLPELPADVGSG